MTTTARPRSAPGHTALRSPQAEPGAPRHGGAPRGRGVRGIFGRYTAGSVIAAVVSEAVLLLGYGPLGVSPRLASVAAWAAGALVNYVLNRRWAWGRRGRADPLRELLPYWVIAVVTMALSAWATGAADHLGSRIFETAGPRAVFVGGTFLAVYGLMFVVKFLIFHYVLFADRAGRPDGRRWRRSRHQVPSTTRE